MRVTPADLSEPSQDTPLPANRITMSSRIKGACMHVLRDRKVRFAAVPLAVAATALTINLVVQATSDTNSSSHKDGYPSVRPTPDEKKEESRTLQSNNQPQATPGDKDAPKTDESVTDDGSGATTEVTVNGERVTVPANGSYRKTTDDGTTKTDVNVENRNKSTASGNSSSNYSSSKIQVNMQSNSSSESP